MNLKETIKNLFENNFDEAKFLSFIKNLLDGVEDKNDKFKLIPNDFKEFIKSYKRIGKYTDSENKIIDILVVKLQKEISLERARTAQRNFIARYLDGTMGGELKEAGLVAFITEDSQDWRFSLITMDYEYKIENGKNKPYEVLSPAKRFSFLVGANEKSHTAQKQFLNSLEKSINKKQKITLEDLKECFNVEKVSKEFFEKYKELFLNLRDEIERIYNNDENIKSNFDKNKIEISSFAKKTLGQIVFLYFLQKKGWLGVENNSKWGTGDKNFLQNIFEKKENYNNFFNDILEPLFYEALATDRGQNSYFEKLNCRIPFLNGGLFEPINNYDWKNTELIIENKIFKEIFEVFNLYNFTVREDEPLEKEVAIDPEMLGKVFEELLEVKDRKSKGAFYTPREIVHYMCQESLINYLDTQINTDIQNIGNNEDFLLKNFEPSKQIEFKEPIKIEKISRKDIEKFIYLGDTKYENKKTEIDLPKIIKENALLIDEKLASIKVCDPAIGSGAFPVGMMNEIVRARLALNEYISKNSPSEKGWTAKQDGVVEELRTAYNFKRNAIENSIYGVDIESGAVEIAKLRFWLSLVVDEENTENINPLPNLDFKIVAGNSLLGIEIDLLNKHLFNELENLIHLHINESHNEKKKEYKQQIEEIITQLTNGKQDFDFEIYFSEVFRKNGGFDIVIGNPPYVQINKGIFSKEKFPYSEGKDKGKQNLYKVFTELSFNILNNQGCASYILQSSLMCDISAQFTRELLLTKTKIIEFLEFPKKSKSKNEQVFESVLQGTCIFIFKKGIPDNKHYFNLSINNNIKTLDNLIYEKVLQSTILSFYPNGYYIPLVKPKEIKIIEKVMKENSIMLKKLIDYIKKGDISSDIDASLFKNQINGFDLIRGANIQRFSYIKSKEFVLKNHKTNLIKEKNKAKNIIAFQNITGTTDKYRIHCAKFEKQDDLIFLDTTIIIGVLKENINFLLGVLNSRFIDWFFRKTSTNNHVNSYEIEQLPIPLLTPTNKPIVLKLEVLVDKILSLKTSNPKADTSSFEREIDLLVYKLYDLTDDEISIIEGN